MTRSSICDQDGPGKLLSTLMLDRVMDRLLNGDEEIA
jgi:hypothetical protein